MPVRNRAVRDGVPRVLGLARSQPRQPPGAWRRLRYLRRHLAQAFSHHGWPKRNQPFRGEDDGRRAKFLPALRHAADLRAQALTPHDQRSARPLSEPHWPSSDLSHRPRGEAGLGLCWRAACAAQGLSRRVLEALQEEARRAGGWSILRWVSCRSGLRSGPLCICSNMTCPSCWMTYARESNLALARHQFRLVARRQLEESLEVRDLADPFAH